MEHLCPHTDIRRPPAELQGQATYSDGVVDPTRSYNYGGYGFFDQANTNEIARASSVQPLP